MLTDSRRLVLQRRAAEGTIMARDLEDLRADTRERDEIEAEKTARIRRGVMYPRYMSEPVGRG